MSDRKTRLTVTIDPILARYAEHLVEVGEAESVSEVVNSALEAGRSSDLRARLLWKDRTAQADPVKVARMRAHLDAQLAQLPDSHRVR